MASLAFSPRTPLWIPWADIHFPFIRKWNWKLDPGLHFLQKPGLREWAFGLMPSLSPLEAWSRLLVNGWLVVFATTLLLSPTPFLWEWLPALCEEKTGGHIATNDTPSPKKIGVSFACSVSKTPKDIFTSSSYFYGFWLHYHLWKVTGPQSSGILTTHGTYRVTYPPIIHWISLSHTSALTAHEISVLNSWWRAV